MTSQLAQQGDVALVNTLAGNVYPIVQTATPGAPISWNQVWVNVTSATVVSVWNGSSWVAVTTNADLPTYIALLTADPVAAGATTIANLNELTTSGYSRVSVNFTSATAAYPSISSNSNLLTFGPMTASMTVPIQWAALVTASSGTNGYFIASWALGAPVQVNVSQNIYCGVGQLILQGQ